MTVFKGEARISGPGRIDVDGATLETERIVVATGSDPVIPPIDGLEEAGYWTNREATTLKALPSSIVILGGGAVGLELGQFFNRSGVEVTLVEGAERLLSREDPAVSGLILDVLREEGVDVRLGTLAERVRRENDERVVTLSDGVEVRGQELLVATGRKGASTGSVSSTSASSRIRRASQSEPGHGHRRDHAAESGMHYVPDARL